MSPVIPILLQYQYRRLPIPVPSVSNDLVSHHSQTTTERRDQTTSLNKKKIEQRNTNFSRSDNTNPSTTLNPRTRIIDRPSGHKNHSELTNRKINRIGLKHAEKNTNTSREATPANPLKRRWNRATKTTTQTTTLMQTRCSTRTKTTLRATRRSTIRRAECPNQNS